MPPLLKLETIQDYKAYYESHYCRGLIFTADSIRVSFQPQKFGHAFYENSQRRDGGKDCFSLVRAERMSWIKPTLEHPQAKLYFGWNKKEKCYDESRRVSVVYEDFVVVVELGLNQKKELRGNFITCYVADNSIEQIKRSPLWDMAKCLDKLRNSR